MRQDVARRLEHTQPMDDTIQTILTAPTLPHDFTVVYDDMHGLWGGVTITVRGDGSVVRGERPMGAAAPQVTQRRVGETALRALLRLLVELQAWEQRTPERMPVADESRATLTIWAGGGSSQIWERVNDMPANNHLIRIKAFMEQL